MYVLTVGTRFLFKAVLQGIISRSKSTSSFFIRQPSPNAPREVPTPLVFVSSKQWERSSALGLSTFAGFYSERGYTTVEIDLGLPETSLSSSQLMEYFENDLRSHIRLAAIPFPPIIFARSMGSLITQTYISSNPASGLVLLSPPPNTASIDVDPSLKEFDFEPKFPLLIVETKDREKVQRGENRLVKDWDVDLLIVDELESQDALIGVEKWMDEVGV